MTTVREHYKRCMDRYERDILNSELPSVDPAYQAKVRELLTELTRLWNHIEQAGVFSRNEEVEELSTGSLMLLTVPYLIAELQLRIVSQEIKRQEILRVGREFCKQFLQLMIDLRFVDEKEVEQGCRYNPSNRPQRIELARKQRQLDDELSALQNNLGYLKAKSRRMRELENASEDDAMDELSGEEEEVMRKWGLKKVEWCIGSSFSVMQITAQEVEMLAAMTDEQREKAAAEYQRGIQSAQRGENPSGRQTYTLLPGGLVMTHTDLRQKVRDEAFQERNLPTMTLQEFAEMEMAKMQEDMARAAQHKAEAEAEDERLGPDGVEERQRQKDAAWDDWKDDNPPIGITTKGNYS